MEYKGFKGTYWFEPETGLYEGTLLFEKGSALSKIEGTNFSSEIESEIYFQFMAAVEDYYLSNAE